MGTTGTFVAGFGIGVVAGAALVVAGMALLSRISFGPPAGRRDAED